MYLLDIFIYYDIYIIHWNVRWVAEPWGVCHKPCGGGKQKRRVHCIQRVTATEDRRQPRKYCSKEVKPERRRECNTHECPPVWFKGPWSEVRMAWRLFLIFWFCICFNRMHPNFKQFKRFVFCTNFTNAKQKHVTA